jgi:hypothetical protein
VNPQNLLLYNSETQMVFMNEDKDRVFTFDLESGKVVDEFGV